jgi:hypothetical protein
MYAEIKDNNKILINRLTDSESILLQNIVQNSSNASITFDSLNGDTGDFDGVMINVIPANSAVLNVSIPSLLAINTNKQTDLTLDIPESSTILLQQSDYTNLEAKTYSNHILINAKATGSYIVRYQIKCTGYKDIYGQISVNAGEYNFTVTTINVSPDNSAIEVKNSAGTVLTPTIGVNIFNLVRDTYTITVSKLGYTTKITTLIIDDEKLLNETYTLSISL